MAVKEDFQHYESDIVSKDLNAVCRIELTQHDQAKDIASLLVKQTQSSSSIGEDSCSLETEREWVFETIKGLIF